MIVQISNLSKRYAEQTVVDQLNLAIPAGQCFGLLGPNGAGKTTTIRMLLGLTAPSSGDIQVLGHPVPAEAHLARQRIGVVPQLDNLDPDFTVEENLRVFASYFGISKQVLDSRIDDLLEFAELQHKRSAKIGELSGGMQRRLTIARALVNDPDLVVLDEPTTGLDPQVRHLIWSRLRSLLAKGKTLLLTTHYMEEAERLCDDLAIIDHGKIVTQGSPKALVVEHIENSVFEFPDLSAEALNQLKTLPSSRIEQSGSTWYAYSSEPQVVTDWLAVNPGTSVLQRNPNLEDVFLSLTRRELRD